MKMCLKFTYWAALLFFKVAIILVILGTIGFLMWEFSGSTLFSVANFWNYLIASIPFSLLAICCVLFVISAKDKA